MLKEPAVESRGLRTEQISTDLVVVGGGIAGVCAAITAARAGIRVVLIQDRPVLGGNASSEVRLWVLGATAHMQNNNRWAREGGVLDEILVENTYRNPEGNPLIFDTILLEKVVEESRIALLLNTAVHATIKNTPDSIDRVVAFNSQNETEYHVHAPLFCDASGDGIVAYQAGAAFRMGAETRDEFDEKFAPDAEYGELLGHSLYFYSKDTGKPVRYIAPSFALKDITKIPRYRSFTSQEYGCRLWWIEYGGRLDTVHDTEQIKWELWRVVYGVWDYIKNSGKFPEAANLTLEWVGHFPGKRESRRFEGPYMLTQHDIVEQRVHVDAVSFGGWSIDLHPADGIFSEKPGCNQWHSRGVYQIPYRCLYSKNIANLFLAGRIISVSHVAFGSTRVMATCGSAAQAVGMAAAYCVRHALLPDDVLAPAHMRTLQRLLLQSGQYIPGVPLVDPDNLVSQGSISSSSSYHLNQLTGDGGKVILAQDWTQMLPVGAGQSPQVTFTVDVDAPTQLELQLRRSKCACNHTPDVVMATQTLDLSMGSSQKIVTQFEVSTTEPQYLYYCLMRNEHVAVHTSNQRLTGVMALRHERDQTPEQDIGIESFEFWTPQRRPIGRNFAIHVSPGLDIFSAENVRNGYARPTSQPNAWVADLKDAVPRLTVNWENTQVIREIIIELDTDFDHPMETVLMGQPESVMPFCIESYRILDDKGTVLVEMHGNHQTMNRHLLAVPVATRALVLEILRTREHICAAVFDLRCYA